MFFMNLFAPSQETFADAADGDGAGGRTIWDHCGMCLGPCWIHGMTPSKKIPKMNFLAIAHTNVFSSVQKTASPPLNQTKITKICFGEIWILKFP